MRRRSVPAGDSDYIPSPAALRALALTYELQLLTDSDYDAVFGSPANRSEQLRKLVAAGLLSRLVDPRRSAGGRRHYYALTRAGVAALPRRSPAMGVWRVPPLLSEDRVLHPQTRHLLEVSAFARAVLFGLLAQLAPQWYGEPSVRLSLRAEPGETRATYLEPDGVLMVAGVFPTWFYEHDRGTMHAERWADKIRYYARAAAGDAHAERFGIPWPPLLITVLDAEHGEDERRAEQLAVWLATYIPRHPPLANWEVWIALYRDVVVGGAIDAPVWRQVRTLPDPRASTPWYDAAWSLLQILARDRAEIPGMAAAREQARQRAERLAQEKAEAEARALRLEAERQAAAEAERIRKQENAARRARARREAQAERRRTAEQEAAREEEKAAEQAAAEERRREQAIAARERAAQEQRWKEEAEAQRLQIAAAARRRRWALTVGGFLAALLGIAAWVWFWVSQDPAIANVLADPNADHDIIYRTAHLLYHGPAWAALAPLLVPFVLFIVWLIHSEPDWKERWSVIRFVLVMVALLAGPVWLEFWWWIDPVVPELWARPAASWFDSLDSFMQSAGHIAFTVGYLLPVGTALAALITWLPALIEADEERKREARWRSKQREHR
ncbi:MAG: replication-relaxation family protein [Chloroflexia bacterium]